MHAHMEINARLLMDFSSCNKEQTDKNKMSYAKAISLKEFATMESVVNLSTIKFLQVKPSSHAFHLFIKII